MPSRAVRTVSGSPESLRELTSPEECTDERRYYGRCARRGEARSGGKETRSNLIDIQRHENDHVNFLVGALGGSARPKLVALTGWGKDEDRHRSDDAGFDAHVVKPVDGAKLLADIGAARQGYAVDSRTK